MRASARAPVMTHRSGARMSAPMPCPPGCGPLGLALMSGGSGVTFTPTILPATDTPSGSSSDLRQETFRARALKVLIDGWVTDLGRARSRTALASADDRRSMGRLTQRANAAKQVAGGLAVRGTGLSTRDLERLEEMMPGIVASPDDLALISRIKVPTLKSRLLRAAGNLKREVDAIVSLVRKRTSMPSDAMAQAPRPLVPSLSLMLPSGGGGSSSDSGNVAPPAPTPEDTMLAPQEDVYDAPVVPDIGPEEYTITSGGPLISTPPAGEQLVDPPRRIPWVQIGLGVGVLAAVGGIFYLARD
jgi:hypothetical protein